MGVRRVWLILLCVLLYWAPIEICPAPSPDWMDPFCMTATRTDAGVVYKLYSAGWMVFVVLSAFHRTPDPSVRLLVALWVAAALFPLSLALHIPYFFFPIGTGGHPWMREYYIGVLVLFFVWLLLHRLFAHWRFVWDRLDPDGIVPPQDRRRALFWHPATALLFHHLAATTNLWWITML